MSGWLNMDAWAACGEKLVDPEALRGKQCWGGLDLATMSDLTAFVLIFPDGDGGYDVLVWLWIPEASVERRGRREAKLGDSYRQWIKEGHIRTTEGNVTDYAVVRRDIGEIGKQFDIQEIAADRLFQGAQLCTELAQDGFEVVEFGQGFVSMALPTKLFEDLVVSGKLYHGGNPVLRWMAANVVIETDAAGNIKPNRKRSSDKIDGVVATIMALGRVNVGGNVSVYEARGVLTLHGE